MDHTVSQAAVTLVVGVPVQPNTLVHGKDHRTHRGPPLSLSAGYHPPMPATRFLPRRRAREVEMHSLTFLPILQLMKQYGPLPLAIAIGASYARILE